MATAGYVGTQAELAEAFGVSIQAVRQWAQAKGAPPKEADGYRLADWIAWYVEFKGSRGSSSSSIEDEDGKDWERESRKQLALMRELQRRRLEGELVELVKVEQMLGVRAATWRSDLERMARKLGPKLAIVGDWREVERTIVGEVHEIMRKYSAPLPADLTVADGAAEDLEEPEPKPKKKRKKAKRKAKRDRGSTARSTAGGA